MTEQPKEPQQPSKEPIIKSVEENPEVCGPDWAKVRLRNGMVLTVGDEGVNAFRDGQDWQEAPPVAGMMFVPQQPAPAAAETPRTDALSAELVAELQRDGLTEENVSHALTKFGQHVEMLERETIALRARLAETETQRDAFREECESQSASTRKPFLKLQAQRDELKARLAEVEKQAVEYHDTIERMENSDLLQSDQETRARLAEVEAERDTVKAFHDVAVQQRNLAWEEGRTLTAQRDDAEAQARQMRVALIECASTLQSVAKVIPDMPQTKMLLKFEGEEKYREVSYQDAVTETLEFALKALAQPPPAPVREEEGDTDILDWLGRDGNIDKTHCDAMIGGFFVDNYLSYATLRDAIRAAIGEGR